eukprot:767587-Prymnesium_polylepis.1
MGRMHTRAANDGGGSAGMYNYWEFSIQPLSPERRGVPRLVLLGRVSSRLPGRPGSPVGSMQAQHGARRRRDPVVLRRFCSHASACALLHCAYLS